METSPQSTVPWAAKPGGRGASCPPPPTPPFPPEGAHLGPFLTSLSAGAASRLPGLLAAPANIRSGLPTGALAARPLPQGLEEGGKATWEAGQWGDGARLASSMPPGAPPRPLHLPPATTAGTLRDLAWG